MRIHLLNHKCGIVIMSYDIKHVNDTFRIHAFRFIMEPLDKGELEETISEYLHQNVGLSEIILFHDRNSFSIQQNEIKYVKAYNGYIEAEVKDKIFRKDMTLHKIEEMLDEHLFVKVNGSCLVNLLWVKEYKKDIGIIDGEGFEIQVSRRKKKEFEKMWTFFNPNLHI